MIRFSRLNHDFATPATACHHQNSTIANSQFTTYSGLHELERYHAKHIANATIIEKVPNTRILRNCVLLARNDSLHLLRMRQNRHGLQ